MLRHSCNLLRQLIVISVFRDFHVSPCAHETSNRTKLTLQHHQTCSTTVCHQGQRKEDTKAAAAFDAAHCKCRSLQLPLAADATHVVYAGPTLMAAPTAPPQARIRPDHQQESGPDRRRQGGAVLTAPHHSTTSQNHVTAPYHSTMSQHHITAPYRMIISQHHITAP
jgi:hypothetical protein